MTNQRIDRKNPVKTYTCNIGPQIIQIRVFTPSTHRSSRKSTRRRDWHK